MPTFNHASSSISPAGTAPPRGQQTLSVVIPVFNEEEALPALFDTLPPILDSIGCRWEILFIDDGSRDASSRILAQKAAADPRIKLLRFSRNFGHQAAITAGLDLAAGDAVVVMDADSQDPPDLLPQMFALYEQGYEVVSAQRVSRSGETQFKRTTAALFYALMRAAVDQRLPVQVGDFRLFSRTAVTAIRAFREQHRFMRGLVAWLGLKEAIVPFHRQPRVAGVTKYPTWKMIRFAWTAISSFTALPLKLSLWTGMLLATLGMLCSIYMAGAIAFAPAASYPGPAVCLQLLLAGVVLASLGLLGDYVARIYEELKSRPLYVVSSAINISPNIAAPPRAVYLPQTLPADLRVDPASLPGHTHTGAAILPLRTGKSA